MMPVSSASSPELAAGSMATNDAHQVGHHEPHRRPRRLDERSAPQRTRHIVEQLGVQFLAAEPGALVFFDDLLEERAGEVGAIFVARAAGHDAGRWAEATAEPVFLTRLPEYECWAD